MPCGARPFPRVAHVLLGALLAACAPTRATHRSSFAAAAHRTDIPQASLYASAVEPDPLRGEAADALLAKALSESCDAHALQPDGRLADMALAIAGASDGASKPPSYALVSYHAHRTGMLEPTPQVWLASGPDTRALAPALTQAVADATSTTRLTHCGAAAVHQGDAVVVALVLSTRMLSLSHGVPRRVEPGEPLHLAGELADGYQQPALALTHPDGQVTRSAAVAGTRFSHTLPTREPGEYTLELLANGPEGLTVVAMFPVAVGIPLPERAPELADEPIEQDGQAVAERLFALISAERARRGLPRLRNDKRLARIALSHSQDMAENRFIAHTSRRTGDATSRVFGAGLRALLVLENIGRGYSASELHRGLMESPGHRSNILHPDARQFGIGVVAEREGDRWAFLATELFTQLER